MNHKAYLQTYLVSAFLLFYLVSTPILAQTPQIEAAKAVPPRFIDAPKPDWARIKSEEKTVIGQSRFAVPLDVNISAKKEGIWKKATDGRSFCELKLRSREALAVSLVIENLDLRGDAELQIFDKNELQASQIYKAVNIGVDRKLLTDLIKSDEVRVAYFPASNSLILNENAADFTIPILYHAYSLSGLNDPQAFGDALNCNINVNCPEGSALSNQRRSVARILVVYEGGLRWCSGALINNTRQDGAPYMLSANHCIYGLTPQYNLWRFYFNYESSGCANPVTEPNGQVLQGCVERAGGTDSDFLLLELNNRIPISFNAYFSGWNRDSTRPPSKAAIIHHPQGDIKKISFDEGQAGINSEVLSWDMAFPASPAFSHLRQTFEKGTLEPGSSGGAIFDQNGRIVGQLHGAGIDPKNPCTTDIALSGWLARSWSGRSTVRTSLRPWLDPLGTGFITLNGVNAPAELVSVSGKVLTWKSDPMPNVRVSVGTQFTFTNDKGEYSFSAIPAREKMAIQVGKNDNFENGVDVSDMFFMRQHILDIRSFDKPAQFFCGDVDSNSEVDVADLFIMRRLILQLISELPNTKPWHFYRASVFNSAAFPFGVEDPQPFSAEFSQNTTDFNFIGLKKGDVDDSAEF